MKRIACAVLAFIPLVALASSPIRPYIAPACSQDDRDNPTVICASEVSDYYYPRIVKLKRRCYHIDIRFHKSHGYISALTEFGLILGWKEDTGIQECGYWSALMDLQTNIYKAQKFLLRFDYENWHSESCQCD